MRSVFLYLLLFVTAFLSAQEPVVMSELDRDSIQIGEQVNYKIKLQSKVPLKSLVPDFEQDRVSGLEILNSESDSGKLEDYNYSFNYLITSFDSGVYEIPEIEILYNDGVKADTALSPSLTLIVFTPQVDTSQAIKDIKPLLKTPLSFQEILSFWKYILAAFLLLALILLIYRYAFKKSAESIPEIILPPHIKALQRLDKLKMEKLWQQGKVKEYYSELSEVVRHYIEERFEIPAMESITSEILEDFKKFSYDDEYLLEILENMLNLSDLVKFAKEDPSPTENETNLSQAYILVEKTKPVEQLKKEEE